MIVRVVRSALRLKSKDFWSSDSAVGSVLLEPDSLEKVNNKKNKRRRNYACLRIGFYVHWNNRIGRISITPIEVRFLERNRLTAALLN